MESTVRPCRERVNHLLPRCNKNFAAEGLRQQRELAELRAGGSLFPEKP
jgi:hypothetical protein